MIKDGWIRSEVKLCPAMEFFAFIQHSWRQESYDKKWALLIEGHHWRDAHQQRKIFGLAERIGESHKTERSIYETDDPEARIALIGSALSATHGTWAATHGRHVQWMESQGVTQEEAVRRHREWLSDEMHNPFWSGGGAGSGFSTRPE